MRVLCNGIPKSGTHAVERAVQLLGEPGTVVDHVPYTEKALPGVDKHIYIYRDLRNVLVSWVRFTRDQVTPGFLICAMKDFYEGHSLLETELLFCGWIEAPGVLSVNFEELVSEDSTLKAIAEYLGVPYIEGSFDLLKGGTATWTGELSDWRKHWTDDVDDVWRTYFGTFGSGQRQAVNQ